MFSLAAPIDEEPSVNTKPEVEVEFFRSQIISCITKLNHLIGQANSDKKKSLKRYRKHVRIEMPSSKLSRTRFKSQWHNNLCQDRQSISTYLQLVLSPSIQGHHLYQKIVSERISKARMEERRTRNPRIKMSMIAHGSTLMHLRTHT